MKKIKLILAIIISICASIAIQYLRNDSSIGAILGGGFALFFAPYLIASFIQYGINISKWDYRNKLFVKKYILIWAIFFLLNLVA